MLIADSPRLQLNNRILGLPKNACPRQTKGLELGWKSRVRLGRDVNTKVDFENHAAKSDLEKKKTNVLQSRKDSSYNSAAPWKRSHGASETFCFSFCNNWQYFKCSLIRITSHGNWRTHTHEQYPHPIRYPKFSAESGICTTYARRRKFQQSVFIENKQQQQGLFLV